MAGELLRILNGAAAGTEIPLQGDFVVGRSEGGLGNLGGDSEISRRHARFQQTGYGQVILEDLGSTNGTHVNGHRLAAPHILAPGDQITMGKTTVQFQGGAAGQAQGPGTAATTPLPAAVAAAPAPAPTPAAYGAGAGAGAGPGYAGGPIGGPPGAAPPPSRGRGPLIAGIAVAALAVIGAVIAVIASSGSDESNPPKPAIQTVTPTQTTPTTPPETTPPATPTVRSVSGLETSLKSALKSSSGPSPSSISCPSNAPASAGSRFVCAVGGNGLKGTVRVTLKDDRRRAYAFRAVIFGNGFKRTVTGTVS